MRTLLTEAVNLFLSGTSDSSGMVRNNAVVASTTNPTSTTGTAVTAWYIIFNHPEHCLGNGNNGNSEGAGVVGQCGLRDIYGDTYLNSLVDGEEPIDPTLIQSNVDAEISYLWAAGGVTTSSSGFDDIDTDDMVGRIRLTSGLYRTKTPLDDLDSTIGPNFLVGEQDELLTTIVQQDTTTNTFNSKSSDDEEEQDSSSSFTSNGLNNKNIKKYQQYGWTTGFNAEIHIVIRTHGMILEDNDHSIMEQTTNYLDEYCYDPMLGTQIGIGQGRYYYTRGNICQNIQVAILPSQAMLSSTTSTMELELNPMTTNKDDDDTFHPRVVVQRMGNDGLQFIIETKVLPTLPILEEDVLDEGTNGIVVEEEDEEEEQIDDIMFRAPIVANIWWFIFNSPENCITTPTAVDNTPKCGLLDLFGQAYLDSLQKGNNPDPTLITPNINANIGILWATSGITDPINFGILKVSASLYRTGNDDENEDENELLENVNPYGFQQRGWTNSKAEVHVIVRSHGIQIVFDDSNDDDTYLDQMKSFNDEYCYDPTMDWIGNFHGDALRNVVLKRDDDPQPPLTRNQNICYNAQIAKFASSTEGESPIYEYEHTTSTSTTPKKIHQGKVTLHRRGGDLLQVMIETPVRLHPDRDVLSSGTVAGTMMTTTILLCSTMIWMMW